MGNIWRGYIVIMGHLNITHVYHIFMLSTLHTISNQDHRPIDKEVFILRS